MQTLKLEDYEAVLREASYITTASPEVNSSGQVIYGSNNAATSVYGVSPSYLDIRKYSIEKGEMFSAEDVRLSTKVCVIGQTIVDNLFEKGENPIGQTIRFSKIPIRFIG